MLGGLLAGAFEGFAKAGIDIADDQIKANALEAKTLKDNAESDRRVRYAMQIKLEQEQVEATRDAMSQERAEGRAETVGNDRRFAKFKADLGQTDLNESQLRQVFDEYYNQKTVEGGGAQANRYVEPASTREKDVLDSLIKEGGSGNLIKGQRETYKTTLSAEAKAKEDARRERDQVRKEDRDAARDQLERDRLAQQFTLINRRLDIAENRPVGGGRGSSADKPATTADLNRKLVNAKERMAEVMGVKTADVIKKLAYLKQSADGGDKAAQQKMADLEPYRELYSLASEELQNFKRTKGPEPAKALATQPKPAATTRPPLSSFMKN